MHRSELDITHASGGFSSAAMLMSPLGDAFVMRSMGDTAVLEVVYSFASESCCRDLRPTLPFARHMRNVRSWWCGCKETIDVPAMFVLHELTEKTITDDTKGGMKSLNVRKKKLDP